MEGLYSAYKVRVWNLSAVLKVTNILYMCGKDMADRYDLHHWDNSYIKSGIIVLFGILKNCVYLVYDGEKPVATFQIRRAKQGLFFEKLATLPTASKRGIGTFCLDEIERIGQNMKCAELICDVYDKSEHAKRFYEHRGYAVCGTVQMGKFGVLKLRKEI